MIFAEEKPLAVCSSSADAKPLCRRDELHESQILPGIARKEWGLV